MIVCFAANIFLIVMKKSIKGFQRAFFSSKGIWATAQPHRPEYGIQQHVTLIPGISIGP